MGISIRAKIVTLTFVIMILAIGATLFFSSQKYIKLYSETLHSRSLAVGRGLEVRLSRLLHLGFRLEDIAGFNEHCWEAAHKYESIRSAMVIDIQEGKILFHNNEALVGSTLIDEALIEGINRGKEVVVCPMADQECERITTIIPVFDPEGRHIAAVGIVLSSQIVNAKTRDVIFHSIRVGVLYLAGAIMALFLGLSVLVTTPLKRLLAVIQDVINKGEVSTDKADIRSNDEIGQVAMAFNMMTKNLRNTTVTKEAFEHQATHDTLTGLPNRGLLVDRLEQTILMARRHQNQAAVLFLDLDNFKVINDSLGHDTGDQVLKTIAERMTAAVRSNDTVSRQAGDEFVLIISDVTQSQSAAKVAGKIIDAVTKPMLLENHDVSMTCSIGISLYPKDGADVSELLKNADVALYRAKELGKNCFQFFTAEMNEKLFERMQIEQSLRQALERDEFVLYYQPKVSLHNGKIVGMEALVRWQHPEKGIVGPGEFIPIAEETGLIDQIGEWVLREACKQVRAWRDSALPELPVAVNVSVRQFRLDTLVNLVNHAINEAGIAPTGIELEVTESLLMLNSESVQTIIRKLKKIGVGLSMDDFGTGYSSLSYLQRFPFDKLKLDISFVRNITRDPNSAAIARAIIAMAHSLDLKLVAEGVETEGQMSYLRMHGCDEMQGYYFSRPLPAFEVEQLVRENRCLSLPFDVDKRPENTLLLVDDDTKVLSSLKRILGRNGYCILTATDVEEAFELLAKTRVGLVIADHYMPDMLGTDFLARVKSLHPDCVRIALTGAADLNIVIDAVNKGAIYKFITKPWDDAQFKEAIHEALQYYARNNDDGSGENLRIPSVAYG